MTLENPAAQARPASIPKPTKTGKDKGVLRRGVGPGISVLIKGFCDGVGVPGVPQSPPDKRVLRCGACPESTSSGPDKGFCDGSAERFQELQIRFPNTGTVFEASLKSASLRLQIRFPNTGAVFEASFSLKLASIRLQIRFPNTGTVLEASLKLASIRLQIRFPNTGTVLEASLKLASIRLQIRFPNTGAGFEAEETRDFKILNGRVTMRSCAGSAAGHAMQPAEF